MKAEPGRVERGGEPFLGTAPVGDRGQSPTRTERGKRPHRVLRGETAQATDPLPTDLSRFPPDDRGQARA